MQLDFTTYRDKVMGCWAGKNIGGVLGAPFEGRRQMNDVAFYTQDLSAGPPPNDDLDLQIVWLAAVERYGRLVDASILGEYWLSYITPNWVEYGTGKANLVAGLKPPLSGFISNQYKDSCGCFIRSEIWACLAPGHPEIATRYAYEDGIVDHAGEGVFGEIFCAAIQSAAFVENDTDKLIEIGLSYIPDDCFVTRCVKMARACYQQGVDIKEARIRIHNTAPGTFGVQGRKTCDMPTEDGTLEIGKPGFDAPENIGFLVAGWLYGEGDFGRSLCIAVNFGEDTDCTAATLGAILGIIKGASSLPEKWTAPINDKIVTMCINLTSGGVWVPQTVTQLTDRVLRIAPSFLGIAHCDLLAENGYIISCRENENLFNDKRPFMKRLNAGPIPNDLSVSELLDLSPFVVREHFPTHTVMLDYGKKGPYFTADKPYSFKVTVINNNLMRQQMWCKIKLYAPEEVLVEAGTEYALPLNTLYGDTAEAVFTLDASGFNGGRLELVVDIAIEGRHSGSPVRVRLLRGKER